MYALLLLLLQQDAWHKPVKEGKLSGGSQFKVTVCRGGKNVRHLFALHLRSGSGER